MLKKAVDFLKKNGNKKTIIIYDTDGDGIGAAAILTKTFKKLFRKTPKAIPANHELLYINENMFQYIKNKKFEMVITVDIPADENPKFILELAKKTKVLVIDHHQVRKNLNKIKNITHINPCLWKPWKDFMKRIYRKYPMLKNKLKLLNDIITSGYLYSRTKYSKIGYDACLEASSPIDILKAKTPSSKKLKKIYNSVEREINLTMKDWKKNAEIIENKKLIILKLNTKFSINSPISNKISLEKLNYTVIVFKINGKMINVSLRRQDKKVNCGELAHLSTKYLKNANGGGHIPAAGAHIMAKDWNKFRNKIVNLL
jgi:oligoribonuclease NrnB/cAMP/cGMP phosphodiesterase (DHH superfamily)